MKESTSTALMFGAALFLVLALIGIAVNVYSPATDAAKLATTDFSSTTTELKDQKYLIYDNTVISGSQVVNAVRKFKSEGESGDLGIYIKTGQNSSGHWYYNDYRDINFPSGITVSGGSGDTSKISDSTHSEYINPSGMFSANIGRDDNNVIRAIVFIQNN